MPTPPKHPPETEHEIPQSSIHPSLMRSPPAHLHEAHQSPHPFHERPKPTIEAADAGLQRTLARGPQGPGKN